MPQGVALLPFIEEERLLKAVEPKYTLLTPEEIKRNSRGHEEICVSSAHPVFNYLCSAYDKRPDPEKHIPLTKENGSYFSGEILPHAEPCLPGSLLASPLNHLGLESISNNQSIS